MGQLSEQGQRVQSALQELSVQDRAEILSREVTALAAEVAKAAPTAAPHTRAKAQAALTQGIAEKLIEKAGGIFLGEKQLKALGVIDENATIPPIPEKFSKAFLNAAHPLREGKIAAHIILGLDLATNAWYCFEKSIVPGSLGKNGSGLSGREQDQLLLDENGQPKIVGEMKYSSPTDSRPIGNVLDNVIKLHLDNGVNVDDLPFYGIFGRTADTQNADRGCRGLLGGSSQDGSRVLNGYPAGNAYDDVGLIAGWN
jgi:hypothetical protein